MNKFLSLLAGAVLGVAALGVSSVRADVVIADQGRSNFSIIVSTKATKSVKAAAQELQKSIELASGAKLPIVNDTAAAKGPFISLGDTAQARAASLASQTIKDEGFRIVTKGGNLYILGPDTAPGKWTEHGGTSHGTANGVYSFLQDQLHVRWLMPGDLGRDVPRADKLVINEIDSTYVPPLSYRDLILLMGSNNPEAQQRIQRWMDRQRLGTSWNLKYNHSFWRTLAGGVLDMDSPKIKELYQQHPDWFAMDAKGQRPFPKNHAAKLETTNQGLVEYFAREAIARIKASSRPTTYSLSPSDGEEWSQSPESKALYDPPPVFAGIPERERNTPSMSSLVLKWYHDVAKVVAREYPQGRLMGYIYADYVYPPVKYKATLPDNFLAVICGIGEYGYGLYRQANVDRYNQIMDAWAKVIPGDWFYYGLPNQILRQTFREIGESGFHGATASVMPAAPDILNIVFANIRRNHMVGANIYGVPIWSDSAMSNYIIAQMMWDPSLDAYDVQKDWLVRAYGPEAGAIMQQLYKELNGWYRDWYQTNNNGYYLSLDMYKGVYVKRYGEMERLYMLAESQPKTEVQQQRLQLIGDNLIVLQWRLRNGGLWPAGQASRLQRGDDEVIPMLTRSVGGMEEFPGIIRGTRTIEATRILGRSRAAMKDVRVQLARTPAPGGAQEPPIEGNTILIHAAKAGPVRIVPRSVQHGVYFATYVIAENYDNLFADHAEVVAQGVLQAGAPIVFNAKANTTYYLYVPPRKPVRYKLQVGGAVMATASMSQKTLTLHSAKSAGLYVYYHAQKAPVGIMENAGVLMQKPFSAGGARAQLEQTGKFSDVRIIASLDDEWKFHPDPQNQLAVQEVTRPEFNDDGWAEIDALNWWEGQGFPEYRGAAWYRKSFDVPEARLKGTPVLYFGSVDGNTEVYLNGGKIGDHVLGEGFAGWDQPFWFKADHLRAGKNQLAVRVVSKSMSLNSSSGMTGGVSLLSGLPK